MKISKKALINIIRESLKNLPDIGDKNLITPGLLVSKKDKGKEGIEYTVEYIDDADKNNVKYTLSNGQGDQIVVSEKEFKEQYGRV